MNRLLLWVALSSLGTASFAGCGADTVGRGPNAFDATGFGGGDLVFVNDDSGSVAGDDSGSTTSGDGGMMQPAYCTKDYEDQVGCGCSPAGSTRMCYPMNVDPKSRGVGACKDGTQTCTSGGEFSTYGACTGAITPVAENCKNGIDDNCDGNTDCKDPTCANNSACKTGCTNGATRQCYDGPSGTLNVGTCRAGTQTCQNGAWSASCAGEVLPGAEVCSDAKDHNCNGLPGCLDLFACITSMACMGGCDMAKLGPGCSCPKGSGDVATCPEGSIGVAQSSGGLIPNTMCCPCTSKDCGNAGCCATAACSASQWCQGYMCKPLPAKCNGQQNADCDDLSGTDPASAECEDTDEPCCPCSKCP